APTVPVGLTPAICGKLHDPTTKTLGESHIQRLGLLRCRERRIGISEDRLAVHVEPGEKSPVDVGRGHRDLPAVAGALGLEERPVEVEAMALTPTAGELAVDVVADARRLGF